MGGEIPTNYDGVWCVLFVYAGCMTFYKGSEKYAHLQRVNKDMGKNHDELKEREYMKRQMEARRKAEALLDAKHLIDDFDLGW